MRINILSDSVGSKRAWALAVAAVLTGTAVVASSVTATADPSGCDLPISVRATEDLAAVGGLSRTRVISDCTPAPAASAQSQTDSIGSAPEVINNRYDIYGDCSATDGAPCELPLQFVTTPACASSIDDLLKSAASGLGLEVTVSTRRGVRVASVEGGRSLHVATGLVIVSIFADTPARADAGLQALRGPNANPTGNLEPEAPRPAPENDPMCQA